MRLHRTICIYDDEPVYVDAESAPGEHDVCIYDILEYGRTRRHGGKFKSIVVKYTDPKFSYKSPILGYADTGTEAVYVTRLPDRRQSQGISYDNLRGNGTHLNNYMELCSKPIYGCIKGIYLSLDEAIARVRSIDNGSCPFDRRLAVRSMRRDITALLYRGKEIGILEGRTKEPRFRLFDIKERNILLKVLNGKVNVL